MRESDQISEERSIR